MHNQLTQLQINMGRNMQSNSIYIAIFSERDYSIWFIHRFL